MSTISKKRVIVLFVILIILLLAGGILLSKFHTKRAAAKTATTTAITKNNNIKSRFSYTEDSSSKASISSNNKATNTKVVTNYKKNSSKQTFITSIQPSKTHFNKKNLINKTSYIPRLYLTGLAGTSILGQVDLLAPILQNSISNLFLYAEGRYSYAKHSWQNNPWTGSLGFGYRRIIANTFILGAYALWDYTKTSSNHYLQQLSPGIELLGRVWDFRVNGYIPVGKKCWDQQGWADTFGNYDYIKYKGHDQYDAWFIYHNNAGIGADTEIGRNLFTIKNILVKGYLNSYYFRMQHSSNVLGAGIRITIQPTSYLEFSLNDSYDKYAHNVFMTGVRFSLYDLLNSTHKAINTENLQHRLFAPIERNFGTIASASNTRITNSLNIVHPKNPKPGPNPPIPTPERTNIWFFSDDNNLTNSGNNNPAATDGTYEHPYDQNDLNYANLKDIQAYSKEKNYKKTYLYFSPGSYKAYNADNTPLNILANDNLEGRMGGPKGFKYMATGSSRAILVGALNLDNNISINNLRLQNSNRTFTTGINLDNVKNITLNNVTVGTNSSIGNYQIGLKLQDNSAININNSDIYAYDAEKSGQGYAAGMVLRNGGSITAKNSTISGTSAYNGKAYGLLIAPDLFNNAHVTNISGSGSTVFKGINTHGNTNYGLYADIKNDLNIGNISGVKFIGTQDAIKLNANNITIDNISNSQFYGDYYGSDIYATNNVALKNINNSSFTSNNSTGLSINGKHVQLGTFSHVTFDSLDLWADSATIDNFLYSEFEGLSTRVKHLVIKNIDHSIFNKGLDLYNFGDTGDVYIYNISNSTFNGDVGIRAPNLIKIDNIYNTNINGLFSLHTTANNNSIIIGNIINSHFNASGAGRNGLSIKGADTASINKIIDSSFSANTSANNGFIVQGSNTNLTIDSIEGSQFSGNDSAMKIVAQNSTITNISGSSFSGNINGLSIDDSNQASIGNITNSNFSGYQNAFVALADKDLDINKIDQSNFNGTKQGLNLVSNSSININTISNSEFVSNQDGDGFSAVSNQDIKIGNIYNSTFKGLSSHPYTSTSNGFNIQADQVEIGSINNSHFFGYQNGFSAKVDAITIDKIDNSYFAMMNNAYPTTGMYISASSYANFKDIENSGFQGAIDGLKVITPDNIPTNIISFEKVRNSTFYSMTGYGIYLTGGQVIAENKTVGAQDLYETLETYNIIDGGVYVNGNYFP